MFRANTLPWLLTAGASTLLASVASASPTLVTGQHNDQPTNGWAPPSGQYTIEKTARFMRNGTTAAAAGLNVTKSAIIVNGGWFKNNDALGMYASNESHVVVNGGAFVNNAEGLELNHKSRAVINGGTFANPYLNFSLRGGSFGIVNGGVFDGRYSPSFGVYADDRSSVIIKGGHFANHYDAIHFYDAAPSLISGGTCTNNVESVFACSSKVTITGGRFLANGNTGAFLTVHEGGQDASLFVNGGAFDSNIVSGVAAVAGDGIKSTVTINGGSFTRNGYYGSELLIASWPSSGGARIMSGARAIINGGEFHRNDGAGVQAFLPGSFVAINNGDFRNNGRTIPGSSYGVFVHSGASTIINGGNFSDNFVGLNLGVAYQPVDYNYPLQGSATINGGVFHDTKNGVCADSGSTATINGGDFRAIDSIRVNNGSKMRVFGGTFHSERYDFNVQPLATIELFGVFDGYDNSKGAITLNPGVGSIVGRLKNNTTSQKFSYRIGPLAKLILHPLNPPASSPSASVTPNPTPTQTPAANPSAGSA